MSKHLLAGLFIFSFVGLSPAAALAADPYTLTINAFQTTMQTNITVTLTALGSFTVPASYTKVLIKALDPNTGKAFLTRNYFNVPISAGKSTLAFDVVAANTPFDVQVNFKSAAGQRAYVHRARTVVLMRTDVAIVGIDAPSQVTNGIAFNVMVHTKELSGALGATFDVRIVGNGGVVVGSATALAIAAGGSLDVPVSCTVHLTGSPGEQQFLSAAINVNPTDANPTNNTLSFAVTVPSGCRSMIVPSSSKLTINVVRSPW